MSTMKFPTTFAEFTKDAVQVTRVTPRTELTPAELADNIASCSIQKKAVNDAWDLLRKMAIGLRRKTFKSADWQVTVSPSVVSMRWDNDKLEAYFTKAGLNPDKFKSPQDTGARVLVKRITT